MYVRYLPKCFPHVVELPRVQVQTAVTALFDRNDDAQNGGSFAVTSDPPRGRARLWLSDVSYRYLVERGLLTPGREGGSE